MTLEQRLTQRWYGDTAAPALLQPLSWLYGAAIEVRRSAYARGWLRAHRVGKPVVVVGNLTVGGTGKTPLVIWLARRLTERGLKVGLVSRGYRSQPEDKPRLVTDAARWQEVGDEPLLLFRGTGCATVVCRDRVAGARALIAQGVDVVIADDGLQHLRLARDCEIVVIDGARGFGNGRVLPAGPLREPVARLAAADLVVMNGAAQHASLQRPGLALEARALQMSLVAGEARRLDGQEPPRRLDLFRGEPVHAVAGIGNPERFFRDLRAQGLDIVEHAFADHYAFVPRDVSFEDAHPVLMTEKDAVKCTAFVNPRLWAVPTAAAFSETHMHALLEHVERKIHSFSSSGG